MLKLSVRSTSSRFGQVRGGFKSASYNAFRPLFNFISGDNTEVTEIAMTAPVLQSPDNAENAWVVSFVMPRFDLQPCPRLLPTLLMWSPIRRNHGRDRI